MPQVHRGHRPHDDDDEKGEDNDKEDNNNEDNNKKDDNYNKGISALGLDGDLGFLRGHQGHQPHDDDDD